MKEERKDKEEKKDEVAHLKQEIEEYKKKLADAEAKAEEMKDLAVRVQADFENYKKRTLKIQNEAIHISNQKLFIDILDIYDNFERALNNSENFESFKKGIEIIKNNWIGLFKNYGIEEIEIKDNQFDPYTQESIECEESEKYNKEIVLEVLQKGYKLNKRVIRPAKVKVGKPKVNISDNTAESVKKE